jgi:hypothetical protein
VRLPANDEFLLDLINLIFSINIYKLRSRAGMPSPCTMFEKNPGGRQSATVPWRRLRNSNETVSDRAVFCGLLANAAVRQELHPTGR